jgi:hypothetical protein
VDVDQAAVYRAVRGERLDLAWAEQRLVIAQMTEQGVPDEVIGDRLGITAGGVQRTRDRMRAAARRLADTTTYPRVRLRHSPERPPAVTRGRIVSSGSRHEPPDR